MWVLGVGPHYHDGAGGQNRGNNAYETTNSSAANDCGRSFVDGQWCGPAGGRSDYNRYAAADEYTERHANGQPDTHSNEYTHVYAELHAQCDADTFQYTDSVGYPNGDLHTVDYALPNADTDWAI